MEKPEFVVAYGKSITSKKGVIGPGLPVEASFFVHGAVTFDALKASGHIVSWGDYMQQIHLIGVKDPNQPKAVEAKPTPVEKKPPPVEVKIEVPKPVEIKPAEIKPTYTKKGKK